jgi:copper chaperone CopZ
MKKVLLLLTLTLLALPVTLAQKSEKPSKTPETVVFNVNMDCQHCVDKVTKQLTFEKGVKDLYVNLENQVVAIKFRPDKTSRETLKKSIEKLDYVVSENKEPKGLPEGW